MRINYNCAVAYHETYDAGAIEQILCLTLIKIIIYYFSPGEEKYL